MATTAYILASNHRQYEKILHDLQFNFHFDTKPIHIGPHNYENVIRGIRAMTIFHEGNLYNLLDYIKHWQGDRVTAIQLRDNGTRYS